MGIFTLKRKTFARHTDYVDTYRDYDETDELKRMRDSDILDAQYKQPETSYRKIIGDGIGGALLGTTAGFVLDRINNSKNGGKFFDMSTMNKTGMKNAALLGTVGGLGLGIHKRRREARKHDFYNTRLRYAKARARRREKADFDANMNKRDGYSY